MKTLMIVLSLLLVSSTPAYAEDCLPFLQPLNSTVRVPDGSGTVVVVGEYQGPTRNVLSSYEYTEWNPGKVGVMSSTGGVTFTNVTNVNRKMRYRISVLLPEGSLPNIPDGSELCWEPDTRRIIGVYESTVGANAVVEVPISWDVLIRNSSLLADLNGDGQVDGADEGILMAVFNTDDPLADLNADGIVDAADLGILLNNWSDSSDDTIDGADAGDPDPIEGMFNPDWESADYIIAADIDSEPLRGGNGQVRIPFLDWQWTA